jgi:hypothetical protein
MRHFKTAFILIILVTASTFLTSYLSKPEDSIRASYVPSDLILIQGNGIVEPFYISAHEEVNLDYRTYLHWLKSTYSLDFPHVYNGALPDTKVWSRHFEVNDPFIADYFWHPAYNYYPVVGVSWNQANDYCAWKTDRLNEHIMIAEKILQHLPSQLNEDNFNSEAFLFGQYEGMRLSPGTHNWSSNECLPAFRLPTEYEWTTAHARLYEMEFSNKPVKAMFAGSHFMNVWRNSYYKKYAEMGLQFNVGESHKSYDVHGLYNLDVVRKDYKYGLENTVNEWVTDVYMEQMMEQNTLDVLKRSGQPRIPNVHVDSLEEKNYLGKMPFYVIDEDAEGQAIRVKQNHTYGWTTIISGEGRSTEPVNRVVMSKEGRASFSDEVQAYNIGFRCVMSHVQ